MASYGMQFEALMAEVCRDFGRRLIRGWDEMAGKEEVREYVEESIKAFFSKPVDEEPKKKADDIVVCTWLDEEPKKKAAPAKKKAAPAKKKTEPVKKEAEEEEKPKPKAKGKGKEKAKCQAVTAKGTACSKYAVEGCEFCSVHKDKSSSSMMRVPEVKPPADAKGGKKPKVSEKKKASPPKHTHGLTSPPLKETCELCDTHGMPFEIPEYEDEGIIASDDEKTDPTFGLEEEDFDDDDD